MTYQPATNKLGSLGSADLAGADLIRLFSQSYGADAAMSLTNFKTWLDTQLTVGELTTQYASPSATSFSVTIAAADTWLLLTPTGTFAAGTLVLPSGVDREEVLVNSTQAVTALTLTPASGDTVTGGPTTLAANDYFRLRYDAVNSTWYRVG